MKYEAKVGQLDDMKAAIVANHDSDTDKDQVNSISKRRSQGGDFHCVQNPDQYGSKVYDKILVDNHNKSVKLTVEDNVHKHSSDTLPSPTHPPEASTVFKPEVTL